MPKFYVKRTQLAYVTEVTEIEAVDRDDARNKALDGEGEFVGLSHGDNYTGGPETITIDVRLADPNELPRPFYPAAAMEV